MRFTSDQIGSSDESLFRILDDEGQVVEGRSSPDIPDEELVEMYEEMTFARHFDERTVSLQRQGRMGTYAPIAGHEAAQVGSTFALGPEDWTFPTYRESAIALARDVPASDVLRYWKGYEEGNVALTEERIFPINIVIGSLITHAAGMGMAFDYQSEANAVVCHFGDGATSEGDFHEGLNFAGVFDTPTVFFCNNNQWAISVPRDRQTASETIAQKALSYGFDGVRVDGMDPLAVYQVTKDALENAKDGQDGETRPTLIESVQYRFGAHTTADDPTAYRDEEELERWQKKDPINRFEKYLRGTDRLDDERIEAIEDRNENRMKTAVQRMEALDEPDPKKMFDNVYEETPERLSRQFEQLQEHRDRFGDDALVEE
jgi:pyruvate dehydrogenase E1 component alpha subunit